MTSVRVACVQASPVFMDLEASVEKACALIAEGGRNGARLVVLPEAFLPAYPVWLTVARSGTRELYRELSENSVDVPGPVTERLAEAAREAAAYVVVGVNERNVEASRASLYNTLLYFDDGGSLMGKHRKLIPTYYERTVWAQGDGSTLDVFDTGIGRLGGLICWENYMPLARFSLYALGTQLYVAPTWESGPLWLSTLQHIAFEGGCFVIAPCQALHVDDIPGRFSFKKDLAASAWLNPGNSAIVGPSGIISGPVEGEEKILYADLDLSRLAASKAVFDAAGHYARPDVFQLGVDRRAHPMLLEVRDSG